MTARMGKSGIQLPSQGYADDKEFWTETLISNEVTSTDPHHKLHTKEGSGEGKENNKHYITDTMDTKWTINRFHYGTHPIPNRYDNLKILAKQHFV